MLRSLQGPEIGNRNRENDAGSQANGRPAMDDIRAGPNPSSTTSERLSPPCLQLQLLFHPSSFPAMDLYGHDKNFSVKRRALLGCTNEAGDHGRLNLESASSARSDTPRPEFPGSQAGSVKRALTIHCDAGFQLSRVCTAGAAPASHAEISPLANGRPPAPFAGQHLNWTAHLDFIPSRRPFW